MCAYWHWLAVPGWMAAARPAETAPATAPPADGAAAWPGQLQLSSTWPQPLLPTSHLGGSAEHLLGGAPSLTRCDPCLLLAVVSAQEKARKCVSLQQLTSLLLAALEKDSASQQL